LAKALGAAPEVKEAINRDIKSQLPEGAGALECEHGAQVTISGQLTVITFSGGELEGSVRSPDLVTYNASLNIFRACDGTLLSDGKHFCCDAYLYYGTADGRMKDRYDYHDPSSPAYANKGWLKRLFLGLAYHAQHGGFLTPYTISVDFKVDGLEGDICAE
jgi:hypothetical protein